ncbi:MAG: hypothetical protein OHK0013_19610 [Sandaracinaceae bacterium]
MMLAQAERFLSLGLRGEAIARAKHLVAQADEELRAQGPEARAAIETRRALALRFIEEHRSRPHGS